MEDILLSILGWAMVYSWIHFAFIQMDRTWVKRTAYEKIVTTFAGVSFLFYFIGSL